MSEVSEVKFAGLSTQMYPTIVIIKVSFVLILLYYF